METALEGGAEASLRAALRSDPAGASAELYRRHGGTLYRLAFVVCQDGEEAEAAVVEAFRTLRKEPPDAEGAELFEALVEHTCEHCFRGAHFTGRPLRRAAASVRPLATLSRRQRTLLGLIQICGYSLREASRCVGMEEANARTRLRSALDSLQAGSSPDGGPSTDGGPASLDQGNREGVA